MRTYDDGGVPVMQIETATQTPTIHSVSANEGHSSCWSLLWDQRAETSLVNSYLEPTKRKLTLSDEHV